MMKVTQTIKITCSLVILIWLISPFSAKRRKTISNNSSDSDTDELWESEETDDCTGDQCNLVTYQDKYQNLKDSQDSDILILDEFDIIDEDLMMVDPDDLDKKLFVHKGKFCNFK
jgi:hypothetical protein